MKNIITKHFQVQRILKNNKGQTLYYFLILTVILIISWAVMLNIARLIKDRIRLQNEADCIALSLATYKARVLNFLGGTNYLIGEVLSLGMNPRITQLVSYSTDMIGGFPATMKPSFESPLSDLKHETFGHKNDEGVRKIKYIIDTIQKVQDLAIKSYYAYHYSILSSNIFKDYNVLLLPSRPEKNLGLKRNSKGINYYSTINLACIYLDASMHFHILSRNKYKQSKYSWFVEGEKFYRQKVKVVLCKKIGKRRPIFSKFLGIHYPQVTVFSAASPYNVKGSMFPKTEDTFTGATKATMVLSEAASIAQLALMERAIANGSSFGPVAVPFIAAAEAAVALNYLESKRASAQLLSGKDNPIDAYLKAKLGGWGAHLVPYEFKKTH
ncbi:MAG: hypothetical protein LBI93_03525 [Endomicrobium sp.]|jgi:hypothetical protein|nr:hypothetical protein [Endomicrobium sp.]